MLRNYWPLIIISTLVIKGTDFEPGNSLCKLYIKKQRYTGRNKELQLSIQTSQKECNTVDNQSSFSKHAIN